MSTKALLNEMLTLLREQVDHMVKGEYQSLLQGAHRHERLLADLETAERDASPEEMRAIYELIELERDKLQMLLQSESERVDFELRILLGGGKSRSLGYPDMKRPGGTRLNRRT